MSNQQGFRSLSTFKKELHRLKSLFATVPLITQEGIFYDKEDLAQRRGRDPPCWLSEKEPLVGKRRVNFQRCWLPVSR
ncbi:hypothetical protein, partial [Acinetobacter baumannii]|uniref:hypothetical protein n=1 Tax=Acinetobacter baumannii TaxID=470 RepID=UPI0034505BA8